MSQKSTSVAAPESEAPVVSEAPPISDVPTQPLATLDSAQATPETAAPTPVQKKTSEKRSGPRYGGDTTKFRNLCVTTDGKEYDIPTVLPPRPAFNTSGQAVAININSFPILAFPNKKIYQYDVSRSRSHRFHALLCCFFEFS